MRLVEPFVCIGIVGLAASPAAAQEIAFDIPAGRLSNALITFGEQANVTIGTSDPGLNEVRSRAVRGRMTPRQALSRLLEGTGYSFAFVGRDTVRVTRAPRPQRPAPAHTARTEPLPPARPAPSEGVIVVTASKQDTPLEHFPGTAHVVDIALTDSGRFGKRGSEALIARLPMLASTNLGPGRNKIFIRGVADSSFNGPSHSLTGQYLGDVRLTFNAPDPDLQPYDVGHIEVLEGPQGTLYGTGSLGGIIRLVPNAPDPAHAAAAFAGGLLDTQHGNPGGDASAVLNVPLVPERLTLRAVAYAASDGGYIDDTGRGLRDVNRVKLHGGRASLLWTPGNDWRVELGGTAQFIAASDGQYAERGLPPLTRHTALAQPFDNDYRLASLTVRKRTSSFEFVSATNVVDHDLETQFDATEPVPGATPRLFVEDVGITLLANETRISRLNSGGTGWVAGVSVLHSSDNVRRRFDVSGGPLPLTGVRNETNEGALFGEANFRLADRVVGTLGARLTFSHSVGEPLDATGNAEDPERSDFEASPTAALSWRPADDVLLYARFQHGSRAGGLAVSATGSAMAVQRFESDRLASLEAGVRIGRRRFHFGAALSYARWSDIQADLIDTRGLPYTTNLGDGRISGLEVEATWQALPDLRLEAAAFFSESALTDPAPPFAAADEQDLPNVPGTGTRVAAHYEREIARGARLSLDGSLRYVGPSHLGIAPPLDARQGDYVDSQAGARLDFGQLGVSLDVDNVLDVRGNRFAYGNPFTLALGNQVTPLRPRTVRFGIDVAF